MTKFGAHSLMFTDDWSERSAADACRNVAEIGYDLVELLMFDPPNVDVAMTGRVVKAAGLELRLGMALGSDADISSMDGAVADRGEATVLRALEIASELGAPGISGITYAAFNAYAAPPTRQQWSNVAERLSRLDRRAGELGVRLGLEPVNRYESYMINTLDQAAQMIRDAGGRNMFIHMDTFHMNIEDGDIAAAIHRNGPMLGYAHVADSNRGQLGSGHFDLVGYFRALDLAGYTGDLTVEGFSSKVLSAGLVGGVRLWREAWQDSAESARRALGIMKAAHAMAKAGNSVW